MFDEQTLKAAVLAGIENTAVPSFPITALQLDGQAPTRPRRRWIGALSTALFFVPAAALAIAGAHTIITLLPNHSLLTEGRGLVDYARPNEGTLRDVGRSVSFQFVAPAGLPAGYRLVNVMVQGRDLVMVYYWDARHRASAQFWLQDPTSPPPPLWHGQRSKPIWQIRGERVILFNSVLSAAQIQHVKDAMANE